MVLVENAMASETETLALHLVRALYEATGGRPQVWRSLEELDVATSDAIEFAVARGWVLSLDGGFREPTKLCRDCRITLIWYPKSPAANRHGRQYTCRVETIR